MTRRKLNSKQADRRFLKAAKRYCAARDMAVGDGTEQWHGWRYASPSERALFTAYRNTLPGPRRVYY